jgi:integrase
MPVPELKQHDNGIWYIHWTDGRRSKRVSTRQEDLAKAKVFLGQWLLMGPVEAAPAAPSGGADLAVSDVWDLYHKSHICKNVASQTTANFVWLNLKQHFGHSAIRNITPAMVESYVAKRSEGKIGRPSKDSTIRRELAALRACLNWAAHPHRNILAPADVPHFAMPSEGEPRDRWLTQDEMAKILDAAKPEHGPTTPVERLLWLALHTAARVQAILELTWDRVDFVTGVIHYDVPGRKKTKKRRAAVPMSEQLLKFMKRAWREAPRNIAGKLLEPRVVGINSRHYAYKLIRSLTQKAGIAKAGPNAMRHTAATHMVRNGTSIHYAARVLGNTYAVTEKHYAKHAPEGLREAVNAIQLPVKEMTE